MNALRRWVRPNDPDTSWDAASAQTDGKRAALQVLIYEALRDVGPQTYDELLALFDRIRRPHSPSGVRTRSKELRELGWVRPHLDGDGRVVKRDSALGKPAIVWEAVPEGEWTGVDPTTPIRERPDRSAFDNAQMRAAITDALRLHADAEREADDLNRMGLHARADRLRASVGRDMVARLRDLERARVRSAR